jgi:hypothetical protein
MVKQSINGQSYEYFQGLMTEFELFADEWQNIMVFWITNTIFFD